jgi:hypothetical protein
MTMLGLSILLAPFVVAVALGWAAHRSNGIRLGRDQFRLSGGGSDALRTQHELDAIRTRFERQPAWPTSGALGERR